ncbi:MAG: hypothetical protein JWN72_598 [Thermoleophilia bacterium]|nr:hypothetical protein [Thermoleophilia bacterium]
MSVDAMHAGMTMPAPIQQTPSQLPTQATPVQGGGGTGGLAALGPVLTQLTDVIKSLTTAIGSQVAGASGGGAAAAPAAPLPAPAPAPVADAKAGAVVQGGGADNNGAIIAALQGVIEALNALVKALAAQVGGASGGGAPGKTPEQVPPGKTPEQAPPAKLPEQVPPAKSDVGGQNGGPVQQAPQKEAPQKIVDPAPVKTDVGGEHGGPVQQAPQKFVYPPFEFVAYTPPVVPTQPTAVAGASGGPEQAPDKAPDKAPEKTDVGGANGGPVQQTPVQNPIQGDPTQVGGVNGGGTAGTVTLSDTDKGSSAILKDANGNSVRIYGDPHVSITVGGKAENFTIGYGPGAVTLQDGTKITWNTYKVGEARAKHLETLKVDSAGTTFDQSINTGDGTNSSNLQTALTSAQLDEFAAALRTYKGSWQAPLTQVAVPTQKA